MVGQTLSLVGTWIQRIAMIWLAYRLTNSAWLLGVVAFCEQIPIFVIAPFAGVYADRWNKLSALRRIEALALVQAFVLGLLTLLGWIRIWEIIVLSLCLGTINAFEVPVRQSFIVEMVNRDKSAMTNAIALNSTLFNLSRLIGPTVAGVLIAAAGEGWCFMINALSYGAVLVSLFMMRMLPELQAGKSDDKQVLQQLREGIRYLAGKRVMRDMLLMLALVSFVNASVGTLAPVFAKEVLHGNASTLGWLMGAGGIGAILGAIYLTRQRSVSSLLRIVSFTGLILGVGLFGLAASRMLALSLVAIALTGLSQMLHTASTNTLLQLLTEDDKRGRVMSFYTMSLQGMMPFGSLLAGALAHLSTAPWAMAAMGGICLLGTYLLRQGRNRS
ncbi:MAG TPA: MFS transporter [Chitinophagaceae bacterium]|nr:MFS transporter [Chitinophagaceae bacterium]